MESLELSWCQTHKSFVPKNRTGRLIELPIYPVYVDETIHPTPEFHMSLCDMRHNSIFYPVRVNFFTKRDRTV